MSRKSKHVIFIEAEKVIRIREEIFIKIIISSDGDMISIYLVKSIKTIGGLLWIWLRTFYIQKWV